MKYRTLICGTATARRNPLTGDWLVGGQKDSNLPYVEESENMAARMCLTIDHYNKTGEKKAFKSVHIEWRKGPSGHVDDDIGEVS